MDPSVILEASNASAERLTGSNPWQFTWRLIRKGESTMFEGSAWTLYPDGTATFRSTVASGDDDDAWVIWHVDLLDANGTILGSLINQNPVPGGDHRKFVQKMPSNAERYPFHAWATFEPRLWNDIAGLKMHSSR
jgi:hypothetical protein